MAIVADVDANTAVACAWFVGSTAVGNLPDLDTMDERFRDDRENVPLPDLNVEFFIVWFSAPLFRLEKRLLSKNDIRGSKEIILRLIIAFGMNTILISTDLTKNY